MKTFTLLPGLCVDWTTMLMFILLLLLPLITLIKINEENRKVRELIISTVVLSIIFIITVIPNLSTAIRIDFVVPILFFGIIGIAVIGLIMPGCAETLSQILGIKKNGLTIMLIMFTFLVNLLYNETDSFIVFPVSLTISVISYLLFSVFADTIERIRKKRSHQT